MPAIQQALSVNGSPLSVNRSTLPAVQGAITPSQFPITTVQPSASAPLSTPSGLSDLQAINASTTSTADFLRSIGVSTEQTAAFDSSSVLPSAISESVTAKVNLPIVHNITDCFRDYKQIGDQTTVHQLINICENNRVEGYVKPVCNVNQPEGNQINAFKLTRMGDIHRAETKNTEECEQPILIRSVPKKVGECFYVSATKFFNKREYAYNYKTEVINACGKAAKGYIKKGCLVGKIPEPMKRDPWRRFTIENQGDTRTFITESYSSCKSPIVEGDLPNPRSIDLGCTSQHITENANGTATYILRNKCPESLQREVKADCLVDVSSENESTRFTLASKQSHTVLVNSTLECDQPFISVQSSKPKLVPLPNQPKVTRKKHRIYYSDRYCNSNSTSLPDTPKAEKIVGGENVLKPNAKHLVLVSHSVIGSCTGTLISDSHVLTAAHCARRLVNPSSAAASNHPTDYIDKLRVYHDSTLVLNDDRRPQYNPSTEYSVKAVHISPNYIHWERSEVGDLAILELSKPVVNGKPVELPTEQDCCEFIQSIDEVLETDLGHARGILLSKYNTTHPLWKNGNLLVQGFGREEGYIHSGRAKQERMVACQFKDTDDRAIVARARIGGGISCTGDSGGPSLFTTKAGKNVQVSVTSSIRASTPMCLRTSPAYSTNICEKSNRQRILERLEENSDITRIEPDDLTRLRASPDSCVSKTDQASDLISWFRALFSVQGQRRITFTNNCHGKNHPASVNVKFYRKKGSKEKLEMINEKEVEEAAKKEQAVRLDVGQTQVVYTDGTDFNIVLGWSDVDAVRGIK